MRTARLSNSRRKSYVSTNLRSGGVRAVAVAFATVLALLLAVSFPGVAKAADDPTITVTSQEGDHTYGAYQVFKGELADVDGNKVLSNIEWGTGVNSDALLNALVQENLLTGVTAQSSAADVAKALESADSAKALAFAKLVSKNLSTTKADFTKSGTAAPFTYKTGTVAAGYYVVVDTDTNAAALTTPILQVVGPVEVASKSSVPTSGKKVQETTGIDTSKVNDGETAYEVTANYEIGANVPFLLDGTVSQNIADYKTYKYAFVDELSKGFTFNADSVEVYVGTTKVDAAKYTVTQETIADAGDYKDGTRIRVAFDNLKDVPGVDANSKITVRYTAKLNEKSEAGKPQPNKVHVEYSKKASDDQGEPKGNTPDKEVFVFTYKVDSEKVDADKPETKLQGAEFRLVNADKTKAATINNGKITGWTDLNGGTSITVPNGGQFSIEGLDADVQYYLEETKAPAGYNLPTGDAKYTSIKLTATVKTQEGQKPAVDVLKLGADTDKTPADGTFSTLQIKNSKGSTLPETGGIGTTIFTIVGVTAMVAAAGGFVLRNRKKA
ncbi:SpaH/EbpB family LPXTG-anchored major pilin [Schaalia turicensis]|uniref:SpaH/EbpB family LPXTG-anchored major pilin n=1 Tax=Schaalia turicensis TaxID=131111 RepID=UPI0034A59F03